MEELYEVPDEFMMLEKQAIQCSLTGIIPIGEFYSSRACERFEKLVLDKELTLCVVDRTQEVAILFSLFSLLSSRIFCHGSRGERKVVSWFSGNQIYVLSHRD